MAGYLGRSVLATLVAVCFAFPASGTPDYAPPRLILEHALCADIANNGATISLKVGSPAAYMGLAGGQFVMLLPLANTQNARPYLSPSGTHIAGYCPTSLSSKACLWSASGFPTAVPGVYEITGVNDAGTFCYNNYIWDLRGAKVPALYAPTAISNNNVVVSGAGQIWDPVNGPRPLTTLAGSVSGYAINDAGEVAGAMMVSSNVSHAAFWDAAGQVHDLGVLPGDTQSAAYGINNLGEVVGVSFAAEGSGGDIRSLGHPFIWTAAAGIRALPVPDAFPRGTARDINDRGEIAGRVNDAANPSYNSWAVVWSIPNDNFAAKTRADGDTAYLHDLIVTAAFSDFFYLEDESRAYGIRVNLTGHNVTRGQRARVQGTLATVAGEKCLVASSCAALGAGSVKPLTMKIASLGGGPLSYDAASGAGQEGCVGRTGTNNVGLLVSAVGTVESVDAGGQAFVVRDANGATASVACPGLAAPPVGSLVRVSGISSVEVVAGGLAPLVRVRDQSDLQVL